MRGGEQVVVVRPGREGPPEAGVVPRRAEYLVRVVVDFTGNDIQLVTVYGTTKVARYCRAP